MTALLQVRSLLPASVVGVFDDKYNEVGLVMFESVFSSTNAVTR